MQPQRPADADNDVACDIRAAIRARSASVADAVRHAAGAVRPQAAAPAVAPDRRSLKGMRCLQRVENAEDK